MATSYLTVVESFLDEIDDYKMLNYSDQEIVNNAYGYMRAACAEFDRVCLIDLSDRDDILFHFNNDLDDEVIKIIVKGMVVEWLKPQLYKADAMHNLMNLKDATFFAPQQIMSQKRGLYNDAVDAFKNAINDYSYNHADLGDLSL